MQDADTLLTDEFINRVAIHAALSAMNIRYDANRYGMVEAAVKDALEKERTPLRVFDARLSVTARTAAEAAGHITRAINGHKELMLLQVME